MHRLVIALTCLAVVAGLAACGGGGKHKQAVPPSPTQTGATGPVGAQPTTGLIGPAESVLAGVPNITGKTRPMTPADVKSTGAKLHGVAAEGACASASANPSSRNIRALASAIRCLLNAQRTSHGLGALHTNAKLGKAARGMVTQMVRQRFFAHTTPSGRTLVDRIKPTGYVRGTWQLGENLAWGSGAFATPASIVNGWMHSPGHRANILHGAFRDIGIGIKLGPPSPSVSGGATYVTDFGKHT